MWGIRVADAPRGGEFRQCREDRRACDSLQRRRSRAIRVDRQARPRSRDQSRCPNQSLYHFLAGDCARSVSPTRPGAAAARHAASRAAPARIRERRMVRHRRAHRLVERPSSEGLPRHEKSARDHRVQGALLGAGAWHRWRATRPRILSPGDEGRDRAVGARGPGTEDLGPSNSMCIDPREVEEAGQGALHPRPQAVAARPSRPGWRSMRARPMRARSACSAP